VYVSDLAVTIPPRLVGKALRKDREQRYQGVKDLQLDLQALSEELDRQGRLRASEPPQSALAVPAESPVPPALQGIARSQSAAEYLVAQASRHRLGLESVAWCWRLVWRGGSCSGAF